MPEVKSRVHVEKAVIASEGRAGATDRLTREVNELMPGYGSPFI